MISISLPRLAGTRDAADKVLSNFGLPDGANRGDVVVLFGRDVLAASSSFADQLVKRLLEDRPDLSVVLVAPPARLRNQMQESSERRGVDSKRLTIETAGAIGA